MAQPAQARQEEPAQLLVEQPAQVMQEEPEQGDVDPPVQALREEPGLPILEQPGQALQEEPVAMEDADIVANPPAVVNPREVPLVNGEEAPALLYNAHNYRRRTRVGRMPVYKDAYIKFLEKEGGQGGANVACESRRPSLFELEVDEPLSYKQAVESSYADQWLPAFKQEFDSQIKNKSWVLVPISSLPPGCIPLPHKWIGKYKPGYGIPEQPDYVAPRFKGRLTVVGCRQRYGIDYEETYAPVPRLESVRAVLSLSASVGYTSFQFDVATAFLNAEVDKPIFMTQPEGFVVPGKEDHVCKLLKAVYGIKQAPRLWNQTFVAALLRYGFKALDADMCVFILITANGVSYLFTWVDDGWFTSESPTECKRFAAFIAQEFEVRCLPPTRILGINIRNDEESRQIFLSQEHAITKALEQYGFTDCQTRATPADPSSHLSASMVPRTEGGEMANVPYRAAVGFLLYLSTATRPDITFAVGQVARFCENPQPAHWNAVKRIFAYLKGTREHGIWLGGRKGEGVVTYTDADYASDVDDRRSMSGSISFFRGGPVAWGCRKQDCVALSTTESEYVSLSEGCKTAVWLNTLASGLDPSVQSEDNDPTSTTTPAPVKVFCDNQSAISLAKNPVHHRRSKHIDVRYHFVRNIYEERNIDLLYVGTNDQLADIFTKALPAPRFAELRERIGVGTFHK